MLKNCKTHEKLHLPSAKTNFKMCSQYTQIYACSATEYLGSFIFVDYRKHTCMLVFNFKVLAKSAYKEICLVENLNLWFKFIHKINENWDLMNIHESTEVNTK